MSRTKTARQREELPCCIICLEAYSAPTYDNPLTSCQECSAVFHTECFENYWKADQQRATRRYADQIQDHQQAYGVAPTVTSTERCPACRVVKAKMIRHPKKRCPPVRRQIEELEKRAKRFEQDRVYFERERQNERRLPIAQRTEMSGMFGIDLIDACEFFSKQARENIELLRRGEPSLGASLWPRAYRKRTIPWRNIQEDDDGA